MSNDIGSQVDALLGTQSCSPLVGAVMERNRCPTCEGSGIVGDERSHRSCSDCAGTGLAKTLADLIAERRELLCEMRAAGNDVTTREMLRAQVAVLDVEIAAMKREAA